jgi:dTDP-4-dehydrorhamnose reductase
MKVLVLGASGMIGSTMVRVLLDNNGLDVVGTLRSEMATTLLPALVAERMVSGVDLTNQDCMSRLFREIRPSVVVNCAGLTKHVPTGNDPLSALTMNALLPHRLAEYCGMMGARLIHVSTDCVFSGNKGNYSEQDQPDAVDFYGKSKHMGEVLGQHCLTLRTSTIGREFGTRHGLLEWFLAQKECKGYRRAIFSGLPTVEFARVVRDVVIPNEDLSGLYHVGARPIDKDSLLRLIAQVFGKETSIVSDDQVTIDRSLDATRFKAATGYCPADWPELIVMMRDYP